MTDSRLIIRIIDNRRWTMIGKLKEWLNKKPTDSPRDEFRYRFSGALWKPTFHCTVCDSETTAINSEAGEFSTLVEFHCFECGTDGFWATKYGNQDRTVIENVYPDEWDNPYSTQ